MELSYEFFYNVAEYVATEINRNFDAREVALSAYDYFADFHKSTCCENIAPSIKELAALLSRDGSELCKAWVYSIADELELIDMDYLDYVETDEWLNILKEV